jgi:hypothetical protein
MRRIAPEVQRRIKVVDCRAHGALLRVNGAQNIKHGAIAARNLHPVDADNRHRHTQFGSSRGKDKVGGALD